MDQGYLIPRLEKFLLAWELGHFSEEGQTEEKNHSVKEKYKVSVRGARKSCEEVNDWREYTSEGLLAIIIASASEQLEVVHPPACSFTPARLNCLSLKYITLLGQQYTIGNYTVR